MTELKICAADNCEGAFVPTRISHIYCSKKCSRRQWYKNNPDYERQWSAKHREQRAADYHQWATEHREQRRASQRQWYKIHPEGFKANNHNRRARIKGNGGSFTTDELNALFEKQEGFCFYCGRLLFESFSQTFHIEHKIPISRGGSNDISNIALSCAQCNFKKGTMTHDEFQQDLKKLIEENMNDEK
jgi:5-methylcytosine-specific restriction endonuclease McrA